MAIQGKNSPQKKNIFNKGTKRHDNTDYLDAKRSNCSVIFEALKLLCDVPSYHYERKINHSNILDKNINAGENAFYFYKGGCDYFLIYLLQALLLKN